MMRNKGDLNCLVCHAVVANSIKRCPNCNNPIYWRKPESLSRTWAYLMTAIILFFPANLLPITYTSYLGSAAQPDTILSSIILLWHHGSYLIASIIFIASILTPFIKIAILIYFLTHLEVHKKPIWQTKAYKFIHFIGRWSMIDVFVVALLNALINGQLAKIEAGLGIFAFAGVVIFTMLATESFDIRLLWDNYYDKNEKI